MNDLISREALKKACSEMVRGSNNSDFIPCPSWNNAMELIDNAPPMDEKISKYIKSQIEYWAERAINYRYSWEHYYARGRLNSLEEILKYMEDQND